jgi:hypothetical protein
MIVRRSTLRQVLIKEAARPRHLSESTRAAIEQMAEEFRREAMADPEFRGEIKRIARELAEVLIRAPWPQEWLARKAHSQPCSPAL